MTARPVVHARFLFLLAQANAEGDPVLRQQAWTPARWLAAGVVRWIGEQSSRRAVI